MCVRLSLPLLIFRVIIFAVVSFMLMRYLLIYPQSLFRRIVFNYNFYRLHTLSLSRFILNAQKEN